MHNLKTVLLEYNIVIDNKYLDDYIKLVENNILTAKEKFKTQKHHVIPVVYYQHTNNTATRKMAMEIADQDQQNFKVNLTFKDHLYAHYLLSMCAKDDWFKFSNSNMLSFTLPNVTKSPFDVNDFLSSLDKYQELYEFTCKYKLTNEQIKLNRSNGLKKAWAKKSEEEKNKIKQKISIAMTGKTKKPMSAECRQKIKQALLGHTVTEHAKKQISSSHKNKIYINKDNEVKTIDAVELQYYLDAGWSVGNGKAGKIWVYNDKIKLLINKAELDLYLKKGFLLGRGKYNIDK